MTGLCSLKVVQIIDKCNNGKYTMSMGIERGSEVHQQKQPRWTDNGSHLHDLLGWMF